MINVVITITSVAKCIFLNFGAIPKRMVKVAKLNSHKLKLKCRIHMKFIYKRKLIKKRLFTNKRKLKIPTLFLFLLFFPYPSFPPPSSPWHLIFPAKYNIKAYIQQRNNRNFLRDCLFGPTLHKPIHSELLLKGLSLRYIMNA